jgi:hypothetical protein
MTDRMNDTGKRRKPPRGSRAEETSGNSNEERRRLRELENKSLQEISIAIPLDGPTKVTIDYSFDQTAAAIGDICAIISKRTPQARGRPMLPNTEEILDAAAKIRAEGGKYTRIARKSGLTPKQLQDRVHTHKARFNQKVAEYTVAKKT